MTSAKPRVDKRRRTYTRLVGEIHHALNEALSEEKAKRGLNKTQIGEVLGVGRSAISKRFDGRHNMTLETLADLAYALDRPVKVSLPERTPRHAGANSVESIDQQASAGSTQSATGSSASDNTPAAALVNG